VAPPKDPFVYDETWNEADKLAGWHAGLAEADSLPPLLGALLLAHAWQAEEPIQRQARLGAAPRRLYLRARGRTKPILRVFTLASAACGRRSGPGLASITSGRGSRSSKPAPARASPSTTG